MRPVLLIHGGAGPRSDPDSTHVAARVRMKALRAALSAGFAQIDSGALGACIAAVRELEDSPFFNAGLGSALATDGEVWLDAAVMTGDGRCGAVAAVQGIAHPVEAAAALRTEGEMVLWTGNSDELAARYRLETVPPASLITPQQQERLRAHLNGEPRAAMGTVGAVCLDGDGNLAAATSTGGRVGKPPARIGDSPLIGAGTWAGADTCAVSATGDGEAFIATAYAHEVHARVRYARQPLAVAAAGALDAVLQAGGRGGAICVGADGSVAMPATTEILQRAWRTADGKTGCALNA